MDKTHGKRGKLKRNILLTIKYDGSNYFGWQKQENVSSVQGTIEKAVSQAMKIGEVELKGTSRTDTGVHALRYPAAFIIDVPIPVDNIKKALNGRLPEDIRIIDAKEMPLDFHPRFEAKKKTYIYRLIVGAEKNPFERNYSYQIDTELDLEKMKFAAKEMIGKRDFASFQSAGGTPRKSTVREIFDIDIEIIERNTFDGKEVKISVTGDGFLYNMVRIIVGTLVDVGRGKIDPKEIRDIIEYKDRKNAGHTAPPMGLYLSQVFFSRDNTLEKEEV